MFSLLKYLFLLIVAASLGGVALWLVKVPQPPRHDIKIAYLRDAIIYTYEDEMHPPADATTLAADGNLYAKGLAAKDIFRAAMIGQRRYDEALPYLAEAADLGLPDAQNVLGVAYKNGLGVQRSDIQAYKWFKLASDQGSLLARQNLFDVARYMTNDKIDLAIDEQKKWLATYDAKDFKLNLLPSGL